MEPLFQHFGLALLLGLLVGLQREHAASGIAGLRTFPLITMLGTASAGLAKSLGGWVVAAGLLAIAILIAVHSPRLRRATIAHGATTDVTMLLMYTVGAMLVVGPVAVAVAVGGAVAVLLQFKPELHGFASRLGDRDLRAIMQFVLITCIILPVLPRHTPWPDSPYAPLHVLNPFEIWLMVVLIVGLSLGGYILYKFVGEEAGILFGGLLGGAVSSTATTVSYARMVRDDPAAAATASIVVMIASTVSCLRVLVVVAVISWDFLISVAPPVLLLALLTLLPALVLWLGHRHRPGRGPTPGNPTELKSALVFGVLYAVVLFTLAAAKGWLGNRGLYVVAGLSGLTEMDAITLSTAKLAAVDPVVAHVGWRMIVLAVMANMLSKFTLAGLLGGWRLGLRLAALFAIPAAGGAALLLLF
jgi:uncharacterized membrane protein (DUF4010 family)